MRLFFLATLSCCVFLAAGQQIGNAPQMPPGAPAILHGSVHGDGLAPLAGAIVSYERLFAVQTNTSLPERGTIHAAADGGFRLGNLAAGTYRLCVSAHGTPYLNPCDWGAPMIVNLAPGQIRAGLRVVLERGTFLHLRVDDPGRMLPDISLPAQARTPVSPFLHLVVWGEKGLPHVPQFLGKDAFGQSYVLAVPKERDLRVSLGGRNLAAVDERGSPREAHLVAVRVGATEEQKRVRFFVQAK